MLKHGCVFYSEKLNLLKHGCVFYSEKKTVGVFFHNAAETWIDISSNTADKVNTNASHNINTVCRSSNLKTKNITVYYG